jgi:hypothetical protein
MSTRATSHTRFDANADRMARTITTIVAVTFLLVGVAGFIPGITTNYDNMTFAGYTSDAKLVDVFEVSVLHNIVHLLFGVVGLAMARADTARTYLIGGGIIYFALWISAYWWRRAAMPTSCRSTTQTTGSTSGLPSA